MLYSDHRKHPHVHPSLAEEQLFDIVFDLLSFFQRQCDPIQVFTQFCFGQFVEYVFI